MVFFVVVFDCVKLFVIIVVMDKVCVLKVVGCNVIGFGVGEFDFDMFVNIKFVVIYVIEVGKIKYIVVDGIFELKEVIIVKFQCENGVSYKLNQIIVGIGGKQVLYNVLMVIINLGDEVIIFVLYWVSYFEMVVFVGGELVLVVCIVVIGFKFQVDVFECVIMLKIKWVILCLLLNLIGVVYMCVELKVFIDVLVKYFYVWVMIDDMYEYLVYDDFQFIIVVQVELKLYDCMFIVNGVFKVYCMIGWCIGYVGGFVQLIKVMVMIQLQLILNLLLIV